MVYHLCEHTIPFDSITERPEPTKQLLVVFSVVNIETEAQREAKSHMFRAEPACVEDSETHLLVTSLLSTPPKNLQLI